MNRYAALEQHADAGLGADELEMARLTRPCERIAHRGDVEAAMLRRLDGAADRAWQRMDEARGTADFERLRAEAFAAKDRADTCARGLRGPSTSREANVEGASTSNHERITDAS